MILITITRARYFMRATIYALPLLMLIAILMTFFFT